MQNLRKRVYKLERLVQRQPAIYPLPSRLEMIRSLALLGLSQTSLEVIAALTREIAPATEQAGAKMPSRDLTHGEEEACAEWFAALDDQAQKIGFTSFAEADRITRAR
jgi:hypothetical protein